MSTQAEIQAAQKAEYDALVARVVALEEAVFAEPPPEEEVEDGEGVATSKSKRHA